MKHLRAALTCLADQSQQDIVKEKYQEDAAFSRFPDIFPGFETIRRQLVANREHEKRLRSELQSLGLLLQLSDGRVRQICQELSELSKLRVTSRPAESFASVVNGLQAELKQFDVRAAILRHASIHAQPDAVPDDGEDADERLRAGVLVPSPISGVSPNGDTRTQNVGGRHFCDSTLSATPQAASGSARRARDMRAATLDLASLAFAKLFTF
ncbi:hypothetical protein Esti_006673 [Eimeria stiedai]